MSGHDLAVFGAGFVSAFGISALIAMFVAAVIAPAADDDYGDGRG